MSGIGTRDAGKLLGGISGRRSTGDRLTPEQISANLQLSKAQAEQTGETLRSLRDDPKDEASFKQIIKVSSELERSTLAMTENVSLLTKVTDAQVSLSKTMTDAVNKITRAIDKIIDLIP